MSTDDSTDTTNRTPRTAPVHRSGPNMEMRRPFPASGQEPVDPFVLLDEFRLSPSEEFPEHPHGGFEFVTYMFDGGFEHTDSTGTSETVTSGGAMRVTTGSGIRHAEGPVGGEGDQNHGLQLWINLPQDLKDIEPEYQDAPADTLPVEETAGASIRTVVGTDSPIELQTPVEYLDVTVSDAWTWEPEDDWTGFLYAVSGEGTVDGNPMTADEFIIYNGGGPVEITADTEFRVVAVSGRPHDEPIRLRGSFVR